MVSPIKISPLYVVIDQVKELGNKEVVPAVAIFEKALNIYKDNRTERTKIDLQKTFFNLTDKIKDQELLKQLDGAFKEYIGRLESKEKHSTQMTVRPMTVTPNISGMGKPSGKMKVKEESVPDKTKTKIKKHEQTSVEEVNLLSQFLLLKQTQKKRTIVDEFNRILFIQSIQFFKIAPSEETRVALNRSFHELIKNNPTDIEGFVEVFEAFASKYQPKDSKEILTQLLKEKSEETDLIIWQKDTLIQRGGVVKEKMEALWTAMDMYTTSGKTLTSGTRAQLYLKLVDLQKKLSDEDGVLLGDTFELWRKRVDISSSTGETSNIALFIKNIHSFKKNPSKVTRVALNRSFHEFIRNNPVDVEDFVETFEAFTLKYQPKNPKMLLQQLLEEIPDATTLIITRLNKLKEEGGVIKEKAEAFLTAISTHTNSEIAFTPATRAQLYLKLVDLQKELDDREGIVLGHVFEMWKALDIYSSTVCPSNITSFIKNIHSFKKDPSKETRVALNRSFHEFIRNDPTDIEDFVETFEAFTSKYQPKNPKMLLKQLLQETPDATTLIITRLNKLKERGGVIKEKAEAFLTAISTHTNSEIAFTPATRAQLYLKLVDLQKELDDREGIVLGHVFEMWKALDIYSSTVCPSNIILFIKNTHSFKEDSSEEARAALNQFFHEFIKNNPTDIEDFVKAFEAFISKYQPRDPQKMCLIA